MRRGCLHKTCRIGTNHPLARKVLYLPTMDADAGEVFIASLRWLGIEAHTTPESNGETLEMGGRYTGGEECYPARVTVGDLMRVANSPGFDSSRAIFMMMTADGPCRFGQYAPHLRKILSENGLGDVRVISPSDIDGYKDMGDIPSEFFRMAWRAVVAVGILKKALLKTRPYETVPGSADQAHRESLDDLCETIMSCCGKARCQLHALVASLVRSRRWFRQVRVQDGPSLPLIGVVGEIFCRLNTFSNENLIRKLEALGATVWLSDLVEYVEYANESQVADLRFLGRRFSLEMAKARLRIYCQHADQHALLEAFRDDLKDFEEPPAQKLLELARRYLPPEGTVGEMVLSVGKAAYLALHGVDGIVDISPFTCMNGIVSEAIYPKLSRDYGGIPIRNFYFDGTQSDLDRDLGIFLELARTYRHKSRHPRRFSACLGKPVTQ
jgi:predicted nucleotide-binding protein (sugar kinase/HSP70/actin superfamily)